MCEGKEYVWKSKGILECDPKGLDRVPQGRPCAEQGCRRNGLTHLWRIMVEGLLGRWEPQKLYRKRKDRLQHE